MERKKVELACIIDDDSVYVSLITKIIRMKKLAKNLLVFSNGKEALDYFKAIITNLDEEKIPEVIFLDINMPVMDGWEFVQEFAKVKNEVNKDITLYMVSSSIDPRDIKKAHELKGITDYLLKPLKIEDIQSVFNS